jgi:membrane-associated phospholipid phosphatase
MRVRKMSRLAALALLLTSHVAYAQPSSAPIAPHSPPDAPVRFQVDPVGDGALIAATLGFSALNALILATGEIRPQRPADPSRLLGIDRSAVTQTVDLHATTLSNLGLYAGVSYALLDPLFSFVWGDRPAALIDASLYVETVAFTLALTDIAKVSVRRPRPRAYLEQAKLDAQYGGADKSPSVSDTDSSLSFFSGHAATVSAIGATATYLAFARAPGTARPWLTLGSSTLLSAFVSYERVRAGAHFPTDVIAGALAGAAIGVIVPHLHRKDDGSLWIACAPVPEGAVLTFRGAF